MAFESSGVELALVLSTTEVLSPSQSFLDSCKVVWGVIATPELDFAA